NEERAGPHPTLARPQLLTPASPRSTQRSLPPKQYPDPSPYRRRAAEVSTTPLARTRPAISPADERTGPPPGGRQGLVRWPISILYTPSTSITTSSPASTMEPAAAPKPSSTSAPSPTMGSNGWPSAPTSMLASS